MSKTRRIVIAMTVAAAASPLGAADRTIQPPVTGQTTTAGQTVTIPKPTVTPLSETLVADPLVVATDQPLRNPYYVPGPTHCTKPTIQINSTGGYAPITWTVSDSNDRTSWEFVTSDTARAQTVLPTSPTASTSQLPRKPAAPTSRLLRLSNWVEPRNGSFDGAMVTVEATDGAGQKKSLALSIRLTRACGSPGITNVSQLSSGASPSAAAAYSMHVTNFDTSDNLSSTPVESLVECRYPNGTRLHCLEGMTPAPRSGSKGDTKPDATINYLTERCSPSAPCLLIIPNISGSGTVSIRLVNPYGSSAPVSVNVAFPSAVHTEIETFVLPSTIATTGATVTGTLDAPGGYGNANSPCTADGYMVWRGVTFSDPSGRAKWSRNVKPGDVVTAASMPRWEIAPGSGQLSMQVTYEVEWRVPVCHLQVIR